MEPLVRKGYWHFSIKDKIMVILKLYVGHIQSLQHMLLVSTPIYSESMGLPNNTPGTDGLQTVSAEL